MRQLVLHGPGDLRLRQRGLLQPAAGQCRIAVHAAAVCGSDVHGYRGVNSRRPAGVVMGHECCGVVDAVGPDVDPGLIAQPVAVNPLVSCTQCRACRSGRENRCASKQIIGCSLRWPGAFADQVLTPAANLVAWTGPAPLAWATFAEPLAVGAQAAQRAQLRDRDVLIIGSGAIGLATALSAGREGAGSITVLERDARRRQVIEQLEVRAAMTAAADTECYDVVIDCVASSETLPVALDASRVGGVVIVVGFEGESVTIPMTALVHGERQLRGSAQYTAATFKDAVAELTTGRVDLRSVLSVPVPLQHAAELFARCVSTAQWPIRPLIAP